MKKQIFTILMIFLISLTYGQSTTTKGCKIYGGCDECEGTTSKNFYFNRLSIKIDWTGSCIDGFAEGYGVQTVYIQKSKVKLKKDMNPSEKEIKVSDEVKTSIESRCGKDMIVVSQSFFNVVYTGNMKNGKRDGQGTIICGDETLYGYYKYVGEWKDRLKNGKGVTYKKDGSIIQDGYWFNDTYVGSSTVDLINAMNKEKEKEKPVYVAPSSCSYCGGTGNCSKCTGGQIVCWNCNGTGIVHPLFSDDHVCNTCDGSGKVKCYDCNGTGKCPYCHGTGKK
ncbi:MAG: hypothetical protein HXX09_09010 [Bacteroidetes bacterium]|nr:hypothetical protein [Bacteroidota bacterium]